MASKVVELPLVDRRIVKKIPFAKPITWEHFKNRFLSREDGYTYKWVNGYVEKTKRFENYRETLNLQRLTLIDGTAKK